MIAAIVHSRAGLRRARNGGSSSAGADRSQLGAGAWAGGRLSTGGAHRSMAGASRAIGAVKAGGAGTSAAAAADTLLGGSWNQLCRQPAQRTLRPAAPIALSGTT